MPLPLTQKFKDESAVVPFLIGFPCVQNGVANNWCQWELLTAVLGSAPQGAPSGELTPELKVSVTHLGASPESLK